MGSARFGTFAAVVTGLVLAGCGNAGVGPKPKPVFKISGKITLNGAPVANAMVSFSPKAENQPAATGRTGTDGKYTLTTYDPGDGAAAGDYVVLVTKSTVSSTAGPPAHDPSHPVSGEAMHAARGAQAAEAETALPEKYSRADQSDLKATVKAGTNDELNFDLKP
jgi:hypothetical protein